MPRRQRWLAILLTMSLTVMGVGLSAGADAGQEAEFLAKINASRSAAGLAPLTMAGGLQTYARSHSADMAAAGKIYHSTSAQLAAAAGSGWSKLGENVGRGPTVSDLHTAFMNSSGHKANILGDYNYVGVGTTTSGGYIYVTVVFMKKGSTSSSGGSGGSGGSGSSSSAPATTTTTVPPTTTTTLIVPPDREVLPGTVCLEANRFWQMCHD